VIPFDANQGQITGAREMTRSESHQRKTSRYNLIPLKNVLLFAEICQILTRKAEHYLLTCRYTPILNSWVEDAADIAARGAMRQRELESRIVGMAWYFIRGMQLWFLATAGREPTRDRPMMDATTNAREALAANRTSLAGITLRRSRRRPLDPVLRCFYFGQ
jgi:hypothetical protein